MGDEQMECIPEGEGRFFHDWEIREMHVRLVKYWHIEWRVNPLNPKIRTALLIRGKELSK